MSDLAPNPGPEPKPQMIDLLLGQGAPEELDALRRAVALEPRQALEFAAVRQLVERLHGATTTASPGFADRLEQVARQGDRRFQLRRPEAPVWPAALGFVAAAAAGLALLVAIDPLGRAPTEAPRSQVADLGIVPSAAATPGAVGAPVAPVADRGFEIELERMREATDPLVAGTPLRGAWERFRERSDRGTDSNLSSWLLPRNAVAIMHLDYELRATQDSRYAELRRAHGLVAVGDRITALANDLAATLRGPEATGLDDADLALSVRALLAAGSGDQPAIRRGAELLRERLPSLEGGALAVALRALGEVVVATGESPDEVAEHGRRLLAEVMAVGGENWTRRRPRLLSSGTDAAQIADAGRFLAVAPAFGLDAQQALFVRLLLAAHLQERRNPQNETPDVLIALVAGFGDLLHPDERVEVEGRLRTWRPRGLLPDYRSLEHLAESRSPECEGYARFRLELRSLASSATPGRVAHRAALCLCLATGSDLSVTARSSLRVASVELPRTGRAVPARPERV